MAADTLVSWPITQRWREKCFSFTRGASAVFSLLRGSTERKLCDWPPGPPRLPPPGPQPLPSPQGLRGPSGGLAAQPCQPSLNPRSARQAQFATRRAQQPSLCPRQSQAWLTQCPACFSQARLGGQRPRSHGNNTDHLSHPSSVLGPLAFLVSADLLRCWLCPSCPCPAGPGPQLAQRAQRLLAVRCSSHTGSEDWAAEGSFLCDVLPPSFSSLLPLGPRKEAGSGK